jgi:tetratricopeptide (TPR) repeat protein
MMPVRRIGEAGSVRKLADNPYPGSRAFTQADMEFFFGRDADIAAVVDLWMTSRLTVVSGPAGCGKTSLLEAGVRPALRERAAQHRPRIFPSGNLSRGTTFPFPALAEHNPFTLALLRSWAPDDVPTRLAGLSVGDFVRERTRGHDGVTYAAIDALDDLVLGPRAGAWVKWRKEFLDGLRNAIHDHGGLHLLLVTRTTGLSLLSSGVGVGARHTVTALTPRSAIEAIRMPAVAAGRTFADKAADGIVADLLGITQSAESAELPTTGRVEPSLLQVVCSRLWEDLPRSVTEITDQAIRKFSDPDMALADHCEQVIAEVSALDGVSYRKLQSWLAATFIAGRGIRCGLHEDAITNSKMPNAVLGDLLDRHLLASEIDESVRHYRLLSDRLIGPLHTASVPAEAAVTAAVFLRAAELALAGGRLDLAKAHAERACETLPEKELRDAHGFRERAEAESLLGNVAYRRGDSAEALPHYRKAAELMQAAGDPHAAAYQLAAAGQLLLAGDEPGDAIPELSAAADREPSDLWLQIQLARALWQTGEAQGAVTILNAVIDRDGGLVEARRMRGEVLADLGKGNEAISDLDHAAPDVPSSQAARGLALAETGKFAAAAAEIDGALAKAPRNGLVLLYAARAFDLAEDNVSAKERAMEAIDATDPPLSPPHRQVALALAGLRKNLTGPNPARY